MAQLPTALSAVGVELLRAFQARSLSVMLVAFILTNTLDSFRIHQMGWTIVRCSLKIHRVVPSTCVTTDSGLNRFSALKKTNNWVSLLFQGAVHQAAAGPKVAEAEAAAAAAARWQCLWFAVVWTESAISVVRSARVGILRTAARCRQLQLCRSVHRLAAHSSYLVSNSHRRSALPIRVSYILRSFFVPCLSFATKI